MALADYNPFPSEQRDLVSGDPVQYRPPPPEHSMFDTGMSWALERAVTEPDKGMLDANWFTRGITEGVNKSASLLSGAIHGAVDGVDPSAKVHFGTTLTSGSFTLNDIADQTARIQDAARKQAAAMTPNPQTTSTASIVAQGLTGAITEVGLASLATGGRAGIPLASTIEGYDTYKNVLDQTGNEDLAQKAGALEGTTFAAGMLIPYAAPVKYLGFANAATKWGAQALTGATVNTALGGFNRFATHKLLEDAGYPEMAAQYKVLDGQAALLDMALGGFFGLHQHIGRLKEANVAKLHEDLQTAYNDLSAAKSQAYVDANLALRLAHVDETTHAPAIPADAETASLHADAFYEALAQLHRGETVDVSGTGVERGTFVPKPEDSRAAVIQEEFDKAGLFAAMGDLDHTRNTLAARRGEFPQESPQAAETAPAQPPDSTDTLRGTAASTESAGSPELTLTATAAPRETAKPTPKPFADLFGQDTRTAQALHDYATKKDEARSPNKDVPLETGDPQDIFSAARRQVDVMDALMETPPKETVVAALTERPRMRVTRERKAKSEAIYTPRKATEPPNAKHDSMLEYLARHSEGINTAEAEAHGIDRADMHLPEARVGIKRAFRKTGMSFDKAAEMLHEAGYPVADENGHYNPNTLLDKIDRELRGDKVFSHRNETGGADRMNQEHADAAEQLGQTFEQYMQAKSEANGIFGTAVECFLRNS